MRVVIALLLCCFLISACSLQQPIPTEPTATETSVQTVVQFDLYTPNDHADGFCKKTVVISELIAQNVITELIQENVLNENIRINSERMEGSQLFLDFNAAFSNQLVTYGTAGELMMIGSVVNTFLSAYGADTVMITVDGQIMESGHVIYDFPLAYHE